MGRAETQGLDLGKHRLLQLTPPIKQRSPIDARETAELSLVALLEFEIVEKCPPRFGARRCPVPAGHEAVSFHESLRGKESTQGHPEINRLPQRPRLPGYSGNALIWPVIRRNYPVLYKADKKPVQRLKEL